MNPASEITKLRREVLSKVAHWAFEKPLDQKISEKDIKNIVEEIVPDGPPRYRCCIYKERAIAEHRVKIAMGEGPKGQIVTVIPEACNGCSLNKYVVTDACQNCVAHPCRNSCPKKAISVIQNRAFIDNSSCVECGICARSCPYHAIVEITRPCERSCGVGAVTVDENRSVVIDMEKCVSCGMCVSVCPFGAITDTSQMCDVIKNLRKKEQPLVAIIAPAIAGQFGPKVTPGHIKSALLKLGFDDVVEAAYGADIVAEQEAEEIKEHYDHKLMTNSCCPAYASAVKQNLPELADKLSTSLSPMRVAGQVIKDKYQNKVTTVFIGPCIAKKAEAAWGDEIDMVLTFEELVAIFEAAGINPLEHIPAEMEGVSPYGRLFARAGGVTEAVTSHLPEDMALEVIKVQGLKNCLSTLKKAAMKPSDDKFTFVECMACDSGCVGGPGTLVKAAVATRAVERFAGKAAAGSKDKKTNSA
ncbi:[FeFe] hydrogenase (group B1/B3) [Desulfohalotomaculum tongense]|uniref:monomeric [FeFe] hydrogenase n=1 Tax=Desulforadius tongensis TaxID=1216062 RepID=UPI00195EFF77|nr:monomeric [FeFe] hydrogenase [Desulforadius tongensis]MBM7854270.1 [FeFe] hydrogenase (group B1/B3) [Desulforadius tongensis]